MTHIKCPVCGKNSAISTFDPLSIEEDIKLVTYTGLGRAKGFAVIDEFSILGDEIFSPIIAKKLSSLLKMFIKENLIDLRDVFEGLDFKTISDDRKSNLNYIDWINKILRLETDLRRERSKILRLKEERDAREDELEIRNKLEYALLFICKICDAEILLVDKSWFIVIENIDHNKFLFLWEILEELDEKTRNKLLPRIKTNYLRDQLLLEEIINYIRSKPKKKSVLEELLEFPSSKTGIFIPV
jgi:hypothetical protein